MNTGRKWKEAEMNFRLKRCNTTVINVCVLINFFNNRERSNSI